MNHEIEELTSGELKAVNELLEKLHKIDNPYMFRKLALQSLVNLLSIKGYSTILWMNRFYSQIKRKGARGKAYSYIHENDPPALLQKLYDFYIKKSSSLIEEEIYKRYKNDDFGFVTVDEILDRQRIKGNAIGYLASRANIDEMGYLWLKITENDMWAFCLRKFKYEPKFNEREILMLHVIGERILQMRRKWWADNTIGKLAEREMEVFDLDCQGYTREQIAKTLGIGSETVKSYIENFKGKLKFQTFYFGKIDDVMFEKKLKKIITPFQMEILKLLSQDMTQAMVAEKLGKTPTAIKAQVDEIYEALETHNLQTTLNKILEISV